MRLRTALNEYKRRRGAQFPEEARTGDGAFSGHGDRLVYVDPAGRLRDYSAPLSGLHGIDRSRLAIETDDDRRWFDDLDPVRQHYYGETSLVETEYDAGAYTVHQFDITLGRAHLTHVELRGEIPANARLTAFLTFAPGGRETQVGRLIHENAGPERPDGPGAARAVEVFHRQEHDYVAASTGLVDVRGQIPERFDELLAEDGLSFPRDAVLEQYEDTHLSGDIVVSAPLEREGRAAQTTLVTQLSNHEEVDRETALADLRRCASANRTADDLRERARERSEVHVGDETPRANLVRADLRALSLLTAPTGAHVAGPEFDPFYAHTGGYGYAWFRDEAEVSRRLLGAADRLDLDVDDRLRESARFFCDTQLDDGTWPHRVWASDGSLAPGWANARVEGAADSPEYQADQTASVVSYLARTLRERGDGLPAALREGIAAAVADGVEGLDATLTDEGLPERCQNCWENMDGQFVHTAATFCQAYAEVARAPVADDVANHAAERAATTFDALDAFWSDTLEMYALRRDRGELDLRYDSASFALVDAAVSYDALGGLTDAARDRVATHVEHALDGLARDPDGSAVAGLVRFEGDTWRSGDQAGEKVWSVATGWGATAAAKLGSLLVEAGETARGEALLSEATELYEALLPDGPLTTQAGYLPEQVFDDGRPDSAAPLCWSHALRLQATALLREHDALPSTAPTPSGPAERPVWTTGEKYGVGTVADHDEPESSNVWFTLTAGALTEVRFPRVDLMNLRTLDFLVVDADEDTEYVVRTHAEDRKADLSDSVDRTAEIVADDALLFRHDIAERGDGQGHEWSLTVEYAADADHDALLADVDFQARDGNEYEVYALANTALTNVGATDRGIRLGRGGSYHLVARDAGAFDEGDEAEPLLTDDDSEVYSVAVAMTSEDRFDWATTGVAGSKRMREFFATGERPPAVETVDDENVVLIGGVGSGRTVRSTLGLGFGEDADTAAALGEAAGALTRGYETVRTDYVESWRSYLNDKPLPESVADDPELTAQYRTALMTLAAVEDKRYRGASIASPSVPWGEAVAAAEAKGYGYNFVWSRDLYQVFTVFDAVGDVDTARAQLEYIYEYQQDNHGFIPQNTYLDGRTRWGGEQMDNISFPAVMAYHLRQRGVGFESAAYDYENVKASADYVARNGPETAQERWEEEAGYSPSSIAAEVAGLACAGSIAIEEGAFGDALVWLALADDWTDRVAEWTATETGVERHDRTPYYVRVTRNGDPDAGNLRTLANGGPTLDEREIIDAGFLELVRLGIKPADDEVVQNSVDVVDDAIRVDTPHGPAFYRYNGDGYGEQEGDEEGAPWRMTANSKGRLWPIFTGERGEYELWAGTNDGPDDPENLLETMAAFANEGRMIAEQVWDRAHGTAFDWTFGEGTGAATPLAWSMAQFVRLAHGVDAGEPVETPRFVRERYVERETPQAPSLRVDTDFVGNSLRVLGETDGELVAVRCDGETRLVEPEDGSYEVEMPTGHGEIRITVAAASDADLVEAATTVRRRRL
ncbi:MAG: glycoside hydrolase family 15 protein [Halolamina sp.]